MTIERVQGGYEIFAPAGHCLGEQGRHSHLCHSEVEARNVGSQATPCGCGECGEDDQERVRRAAPGLLKALEECVKQLKWYRENDDREGIAYMGEDEPQDAINAGVAAIARARGVSE